METNALPRWKRLLPFFALGAALLADQLTKLLVRDALGPGGAQAGAHLRLIGDWFWLVFHENPGVSFGLFAGLPRGVAVPVFAAVTLGALWLIRRFYLQTPPERLLPRLALMGIAAGAIGNNLVDRLFLGRVTDFLALASFDAVTGTWRSLFPVFNVADACITCGVAVLLWTMLGDERARRRAARLQAQGGGQAPDSTTGTPD